MLGIFFNYPKLVVEDLLLPSMLVVVPTFKDDPVFFLEIFNSAIQRWKRYFPDLSEMRVEGCIRNYFTTIESIETYVRFHNWGLILVAQPKSKGSKREKEDNCYLSYFKENVQLSPLTGETLRELNTYHHEGYGHGVFELTLLSAFLKLLEMFLVKKYVLPTEVNVNEIRMGSIFGEAWAGYFCEDYRCTYSVSHYCNVARVLQEPYVGGKSRDQKYELGYIAGPRFWMSIEVALLEALLKAKALLEESNANVSDGDQSSLTPQQELLIDEFRIVDIITGSDLRKSVKLFLFSEILKALSSVYETIRMGVNIITNYTNLSELINIIINTCLKRLLSRLSEFGITQEQIENIYSSFSSLNDMLNRYPTNLRELLIYRLGLNS